MKKLRQIEAGERRPPVACSVEQTCKELDICKPTLYTLFRTGEIESFFVGKRRLVPYESLLRFCRERVAAAR